MSRRARPRYVVLVQTETPDGNPVTSIHGPFLEIERAYALQNRVLYRLDGAIKGVTAAAVYSLSGPTLKAVAEVHT